MAQRAAIVTGGVQRHRAGASPACSARRATALTVAARRPEKLEAAVEGLRAEGYDVNAVAGNLGDEDGRQGGRRCPPRALRAPRRAGQQRRRRHRRAGRRARRPRSSTCSSASTCARPILFYRECVELLRAAGAEHRSALVVNTASISGKRGEAWLSVYCATKAAVVGFTQAMHKELGGDGHQVDRAVPRLRRHADDRLRQGAGRRRGHDPGLATSPRPCACCSSMSPGCIVPEVQFLRPGRRRL